jgi:hypothetical protein
MPKGDKSGYTDKQKRPAAQIEAGYRPRGAGANGKPFDPHRHEALSQGHNPAQTDHAILEVVQRGYQRGAKVVRPAKVVVNDLALSKTADHGR